MGEGNKRIGHLAPRALAAMCVFVLAIVMALVLALVVAQVVLAHMPTIMNIYREPPGLEQNDWRYDKSDLPSAKVRHPVLGPEAWWVRPKSDWQAVYDAWPPQMREKVPGGAAGMGRELERMQGEARESVAGIMEMSEDELVRYVPPQSPVGPRKNYCPACEKGKLVWAGPEAWDSVRCSACGETFPNERFPAERKHAIGGPLGRPAIFRYYRDKRGFNHFFKALTYGAKRDRAVEYGLALARAYHVTRTPEYARRAALLLDRLGTVYPLWCMRTGSYPHIYVQGDGFHPGVGVYDRWHGRWMHGVPFEAVSSYEPIYDLIYESTELDRLSEEKKYDVRRHIERNFFYENVAVFFSAAPPFGPTGNLEHVSVIGVVRKARVLNDSRLIHRCHNWAKKTAGAFHYDGTHRSGSGGGDVAAGLKGVVFALRGWTDPPGCDIEWGDSRIEDFNEERHFPILRKIEEAADRARAEAAGGAPKGECSILPGWGRAVLGAGEGDGVVLSGLEFSGDYGDGSRRNLATTLHAFGREMIARAPSPGAKATEEWRRHTVGHNTVVIDRLSQARGEGRQRFTDCDLLAYVPTMPGLSMVEARGERGYPGPEHDSPAATTYRRMQVLVSVDERRPYVIDVFGVAGGRVHDYVVHGSRDRAMTAETALALAPGGEALIGDERAAAPDAGDGGQGGGAATWREAYGQFGDVRAGRTSDAWHATFRFADERSMGVRVHMAAGPETEVFLARTHLPDGRPDAPRPALVARRTREPGIKDVFVSVLEPFRDGSAIESVEQIETTPADGGAFALRVTWRDRIDTLLVNPGGAGRVRTPGGAELDGRVGFISERGAAGTSAYLVGGKRLRKGAVELTMPAGVYEGMIADTLRIPDGDESNGFLTSAAVPVGTALRGRFLIVTMPKVMLPEWNTSANAYTHGYEIDRVERVGDGVLIRTMGDHGIQIQGDNTIAEVYAPRRRYVGRCRFRILDAAHAVVPTPASE